MHQYWWRWCWLLGKKAVWRHQGHDPGHWLHHRGSNSAQRILSPMLEVAIKPPNAKRWAFPFIGVGASCKRTKGRAPGVWVQQIFTANTWCPMLPFRSGIPLFTKWSIPATPYKPNHTVHTELDFALTRSKLVGMSMRDYQSHTSNLLHNI